MSDIDFEAMLTDPTELDVRRAGHFLREVAPIMLLNPGYWDFAVSSVARFMTGLRSEAMEPHLTERVVLPSGGIIAATDALCLATVKQEVDAFGLDRSTQPVLDAICAIQLASGAVIYDQLPGAQSNG